MRTESPNPPVVMRHRQPFAVAAGGDWHCRILELGGFPCLFVPLDGPGAPICAGAIHCGSIIRGNQPLTAGSERQVDRLGIVANTLPGSRSSEQDEEYQSTTNADSCWEGHCAVHESLHFCRLRGFRSSV